MKLLTLLLLLNVFVYSYAKSFILFYFNLCRGVAYTAGSEILSCLLRYFQGGEVFKRSEVWFWGWRRWGFPIGRQTGIKGQHCSSTKAIGRQQFDI